jgi:uncharacterized cupredoxin-like copper-binding protein
MMTMRRSSLAVATMLVAGGLVLAACGTAEPATDVSVSMTEFDFEPDDITLPVGEEVTIRLTNDGDIRHEFMVGRDVMTDNGTPAGHMHDFFDGIHPTVVPEDAVVADDHHAHGGFMVMLDPGQSADVTFTVPEGKTGEWEIGCFEPGHHEAGMHATLTVE